MNKIIIGIFIMFSAVNLSACGISDKIGQKAGEKILEKTIESQSGDKVDINSEGGNVTVKTADGQTQYSTGGQTKLPDNFPKELIVASDAKIILSSSSPQGNSVGYVTDILQSDLQSRYISNLESSGWKKASEVNSDGSSMFNFTKEKMSVVILIGKNTNNEQKGNSFVNVILVDNIDK